MLEAEDKAGNVSQASVPVVVDRTPPHITIESPVENATLGGLPVVVQGTVSDETATMVTVNGVVAIRTGEAWQAPFDGHSEGTQSFQATAVDAAGNESAAARTVRLDLLPPVVAIDSPATATLTREGSV